MARKAEPQNKNLKQYATKVDPTTRQTLDLIPKIAGEGYGQRELIADMLELYFEKYPERKKKVEQLRELLGGE